MSGHGRPTRASRGRAYRIRVRGERRVQIDFPKLSRALLEHAALEAHRTQQGIPVDRPADNETGEDVWARGGGQ